PRGSPRAGPGGALAPSRLPPQEPNSLGTKPSPRPFGQEPDFLGTKPSPRPFGQEPDLLGTKPPPQPFELPPREPDFTKPSPQRRSDESGEGSRLPAPELKLPPTESPLLPALGLNLPPPETLLLLGVGGLLSLAAVGLRLRKRGGAVRQTTVATPSAVTVATKEGPTVSDIVKCSVFAPLRVARGAEFT